VQRWEAGTVGGEHHTRHDEVVALAARVAVAVRHKD